MYNILIAFGAGTVVTILFGWLLGMPRIVIGYGIVPGFIVFVAVLIWLSRKVSRQLQAIMARVEQELQPKGTARVDRERFKRARDILKEGYQFSRWQFMVKGNIDAQIGQLHYLNKEFDEAAPYLENAPKRNWIARAMLAVTVFKKKQYDRMKEIFEHAVKANKKESLLWNLYAYCLWKAGERDAAIDVLSRAGEILEDDERITSNKLALQKKKKMKMRGWKEMWYQFHLDTPPQPKMQIDRRSMYRGR